MIKKLLMMAAYKGLQGYWRLFRPITVGVRILLIENDEVLLVLHTYLPDWHLPGGGVKRGETTAEAARREAREEVGAICYEEPELIGIFASFQEGKSNHVAVYCCHAYGIEEAGDRGWEIARRERFALTDLPANVSRGTRSRVEDYLRFRTERG